MSFRIKLILIIYQSTFKINLAAGNITHTYFNNEAILENNSTFSINTKMSTIFVMMIVFSTQLENKNFV